tara:strand:+ start:92 stop:589 length:498 start_codon:yes stop_codon:yes gene_type:complete
MVTAAVGKSTKMAKSVDTTTALIMALVSAHGNYNTLPAENKMTKREVSKEFRDLCDKYNLRYKPNEAGEPTSPTRKRVNPHDHLYHLSSTEVGVAVSRETKKKYTFLKNKLVKMGCKILQEGDTEGNFSVSEKKLLEVAKLLSCVKKNRTFSQEEREAIRRRLIG